MSKLMTRDKSFYRTLIMLAIPITLQNAITFAVGFADNLMVGTLGELAIAGVYVGNQLQTFLQFAVSGLSSAAMIISAHYWGRRDTVSIKKVSAMTTLICVAVGALSAVIALLIPRQLLGLFTDDVLVIEEGVSYLEIVCISYVFFCISQMAISALRSVESVRIGLINSIVALITNITLNYVLIFGKLGFPALGVRGAAIATLISRIVETAVMVIYIFRIDTKLRFKPREIFLYDSSLIRDLFRYGTPVLAGQIVWAINQLSQSAIIGHMSTEAVASVSIAGMLNSMLYMIVIGLSAALGVITGKTVGAGEYEKMKEYSYTSQIIFALLGVIMGTAVFLLKDLFISFYNLADQTKVVAEQFMIVLAVAMVGRCYQAPLLAGLVKAGGDTGFVFKNDTIFVFGVVLPSALIAQFVFDAPPWVVYACLQSDQILKCFVAVVKINSFNWMKNLTRTQENA